MMSLRSGKQFGRIKKKTLPRDLTHWQIMYRGFSVHLFAVKFFGISAWSVTHGGIVRNGWTDATCYREVIQMKKKTPHASQSEAHHLAAVESDLFSKFAPLVQHCCVTRYDDGDARQPGWWTVKTMGSAWIIEVKDPDTCSRLVVVQQTLDDAIALASILLESEEAPWELDPWLSAAKAKKKK